MSSAAPLSIESKSAKKRKAKGETAPSASGAATPSAEPAHTEVPTNGVESHAESVYIKELIRYVRAFGGKKPIT